MYKHMAYRNPTIKTACRKWQYKHTVYRNHTVQTRSLQESDSSNTQLTGIWLDTHAAYRNLTVQTRSLQENTHFIKVQSQYSMWKQKNNLFPLGLCHKQFFKSTLSQLFKTELGLVHECPWTVCKGYCEFMNSL